MTERNKNDLTGHPSDYGSRTLQQPDAEHEDDRQRSERGDIGRTADGEPWEDRGTADSAISHDNGGK
jgi:hypothetical protein